MKRMKEVPGSREIGLRPEEMRSLRKLLLARKADPGTDSVEQFLSRALLDNESSALREIDPALERLDESN